VKEQEKRKMRMGMCERKRKRKVLRGICERKRKKKQMLKSKICVKEGEKALCRCLIPTSDTA
jgi:hypothetical protein